VIRAGFWLTVSAAGLMSCGYHVEGKADLVPKSVQTIAVPTFSTVTTKYRLIDILPQQISREFVARTRFRMEQDPDLADAVLKGSVNNVVVYPAVSDPTSGKATSIRVVVFLTINFIERKTGKVLYTHPNWAVHEDYADAIDPHQFFDESGAAYDRLSKDVARDVVSGIVENF
jgi:Lipopolysaccharide-assembly